MKRILALMMLCFVCLCSPNSVQAIDRTTYLQLWQVPDDTMDWGSYWRLNNSLLDAACMKGVAASVADEVMLFSNTTGLQVKRATITGVPKLTSGVLSAAVANVDYGAIEPIGMINMFAGFTAPTNWLMCDGAAISRTTYSSLFAVLVPSKGTVTITLATDIFTLNGHALRTGDAVYLTTTGALPTNVTANTLYYVIWIDANNFYLATTRAFAFAGTPRIDPSGSQSGTHTLYFCPYGLGNGSTTFNVPNMLGKVPVMQAATTDADFQNFGATGGEKTHVLTVAELAAHSHASAGAHTHTSGSYYNRASNGAGDYYLYNSLAAYPFSTSSDGAHSHPAAGSDTAHNNIQPYIVLNYIIKYQ